MARVARAISQLNVRIYVTVCIKYMLRVYRNAQASQKSMGKKRLHSHLSWLSSFLLFFYYFIQPQTAILHKHNGHISMPFLLSKRYMFMLSWLLPFFSVTIGCLGCLAVDTYYDIYCSPNEMSKRVFIWFHAKLLPAICLFYRIAAIYSTIQRHRYSFLLNSFHFHLRVDIWSTKYWNGYEYGLQTQIVRQRQRRKWHRDCRCW